MFLSFFRPFVEGKGNGNFSFRLVLQLIMPCDFRKQRATIVTSLRLVINPLFVLTRLCLS